MLGKEIKVIISDFDGTLVDTFTANFKAYQKAFGDLGFVLNEEDYNKCYGFRFEEFMKQMGILDGVISNRIKELKAQYYPTFFNEVKVNTLLLEIIQEFRQNGGKTAIASTASKKNLWNLLTYLRIDNYFDYIVTGEDVTQGKPSPEVYNKVLQVSGVCSKEAIVFEDSVIGIQAAKAAGINYVVIKTFHHAN